MNNVDDASVELVEQLVDRHDAGATSPGLAYGVVLDGRLVHSGSRGERRLGDDAPDVDTVFRIASMTKSFTAAAVLVLRDEGRLRLDDPVMDYVPQAAGVRPPTSDSPPWTIRSLLTMTAGLPTDDPWGDRQQDLPEADFDALLDGGLSFAWTPGTAFEYSNLGYALLGRVIAAAAREGYPDVVTRRLLTPLAMASSGFHPPGPESGSDLAQGYQLVGTDWEAVPPAEYGAFAPMGGLFSTVSDLARWVGWLSGAFPPRDSDHPSDDAADAGDPDRTVSESAALSRASRRELQLPHLALPATISWTSLAEPPVVRSVAYGFGLVVEQDPRLGMLVSHSGGYPGFGSHMRWHPGSGLGVVVLANSTYAPAARLGSRLIDALLAARGVGTRRPGASPAPATGSMVEATAAARGEVIRLVNAWDDDLADRLLAANVDLDDPLHRRRRRLAEAVERLGPFEPDEDEPVVSLSPAHSVWWMRGPGGRLRCEIRMTPEVPPRVQTLNLAPVPTPSATLTRLAARVADLLTADAPRWPDDVPLAAGLTADRLARQLRVAAAWAGPVRREPVPVAGDGRREAVFRLDGERLALWLTLALSGERVTACTLVPEG